MVTQPPASENGINLKAFVSVLHRGKTLEVDKVVAKQSMMIEHLLEDRLTRTSPVVIRNVSGDILAKIVDYCKCVVSQPPSCENDVELKKFLSELVNNNEQTLFGIFVDVDYLDIKGILSLACENVMDMIKHEDQAHICSIFNVMLEFSPEEKEMMRRANPWAFN
ncbi:hypothetical protein M9H77_21522 [Catharanthus roseus]|uniref:Uncharacterized protein n=1 Tax=Catharanthus roseus TaxID=4058 RepID=A0ACC0AMY2_CATRO|nr:hypothetical protein M9H77_21522 [Catharanthus roseus]